MKFFNTAGPVNQDNHYCLDPLSRFDIDYLMTLIHQQKYFVLHAPRQTGKTSMLFALMERINQEGRYHCLYVNVEPAQAAREQVSEALHSIIEELANALNDNDPLERDLQSRLRSLHQSAATFSLMRMALTLCAKILAKPLILLIDEIDSLVGDTLIAVLRQLRAGYTSRPENFPQSIVLCGVRDVRDYRIHASSEKEPVTGGSAFNVKARSLRLGNFDRDEVQTLLRQHTNETSQEFTPEAVDSIWQSTLGQPWLVNALAYEVTFEMAENQDHSVTITAEMVQQARETLILRRETHLDQLADKLREPRVHRVIAPILAGADISTNIPDDDLSYAHDLGLIEKEPKVSIANPIYREVIPRTLILTSQVYISHDRSWYTDPTTGRLDMTQMMKAFQQFFRENIEHWVEHYQYKEAGPQLLLQAFLQRVINGGGRIEREYGLGSGRTDLYLTFPYSGGVQRIVLELKLRKGTRQATIEKALPQITGYMDRCGTKEGHLIIFDQSETSWEEKIFHQQTDLGDVSVAVWGM